MAGADNVVFNNKEKAISSDVNIAQAMEARTLMTLLRFWNMSRLSGIGLSNDLEGVHPIVNGLQVVPNGNNVDIQAGFVLQDSNTISPVPGTYDSTYRCALNLTTLNVIAPAPAGNTYYLLEVQMQEVTANESRDILNGVTGNFVAASVPKIRTRTLSTAWRAGSATAYPNPTGGDWVVLAGVYRPAGGGPVSLSHIQDMRLQPDLLIGEAHIERAARPSVNLLRVAADNDTAVRLSVGEAPVYCGSAFYRALRCHVRVLQGGSPAGWDPADALIKDTTTTFAANTWYYVYVTHWKGLAPRMFAPSGMVSRGVVVCSHVAPNGHSSSNSAALNLPNPFGGTVPAGEACCVGILRRNNANNGWMSVHGCGDTYRVTGLTTTDGSGIQVGTGAGGAVINVPAADLPRARLIRFKVDASLTLGGGPALASGYLTARVRPTGGAISDEYALWRFPAPAMNTTQRLTCELDAPYDSTGLDFLVDDNTGAVVTAGTVNIAVIGWTM